MIGNLWSHHKPKESTVNCGGSGLPPIVADDGLAVDATREEA
jgi:hypothetical protein